MADQRQSDAVTDGAGDGHGQQHHRHRQQLGQVGEVDVPQVGEHQDAHVDQRRGRGRRRDDGRRRCDEHAQQEQHARGDGGQAGAPARLHAGGRFHEGGDGGGAGQRAGHGADGVGQQRLLHLRHLALLVEHVGAGRGAHQRADGVEHVDDT